MNKAVILITGIALLISACATAEKPYDVVIQNGRIFDGTGNPWYYGDIGIRGNTIATIGDILPDQGNRIIDADGKAVAPGFIDIHTHTDGILEDPSAHNYILQGVTTVVDGNCGGSPINLAKHFSTLESMDIALNYATFIGQNSIRSKVMGSADRPPTSEELDTMKKLVEDSMKAGAVGMSNGLKYKPAVFAATDEVVELAKVAARYGGFYATHMRSEGETVIESVKEAIEIGEKAGIPVQISHFKALSVERWGASVEMLRLIDDARRRGIDVKADQYPYTASSTGLSVLLPPWALEGDGWKEKIKDTAQKEKIKEDIIYAIVHERAGDDLNRIQISRYAADTSLEGMGLGDILEKKGRKTTPENAADLVLELLLEGSASAIYHTLSEDDVERIMRHPAVMHASDGSITETDVGVPHPRCYGTFPRVLARYVREKGIITLEEAVRKMTSLPARRIGADNTGTITPGKRADIVIFDPETIADTATFEDPHSYPLGIDYVLVNGVIVADHGEITGAMPGRIIYGPGSVDPL